MIRAMKHSHSLAALLAVTVSCGWMMSPSTASASDLLTITVVPAEDDRAYITTAAMEPATQLQNSGTSFRRVKPTRRSVQMVPAQMDSRKRPAGTQIAWPYTARTIDMK